MAELGGGRIGGHWPSEAQAPIGRSVKPLPCAAWWWAGAKDAPSPDWSEFGPLAYRRYRSENLQLFAMTAKEKHALKIPCPTCGVRVGEKCVLTTGQHRTAPHRERRELAADE